MQDLDRYPGQPDSEITQHVFTKSIFAIVPFLFAGVVLGFIALYGIYYGARYQPKIGGIVIGSNLGMSFISLILFGLVVLMILAVIWIWRRNRIIVTNEHIVDVDQTGLFNRAVATLTLVKIQDVSASIKGPWQTLFQYGTINIQTAGERDNFTMDYIPDPYTVERYILEVQRQFVRGMDEPVPGVPTAKVSHQELPPTQTPDQPVDNKTTKE